MKISTYKNLNTPQKTFNNKRILRKRKKTLNKEEKGWKKKASVRKDERIRQKVFVRRKKYLSIYIYIYRQKKMEHGPGHGHGHGELQTNLAQKGQVGES